MGALSGAPPTRARGLPFELRMADGSTPPAAGDASAPPESDEALSFAELRPAEPPAVLLGDGLAMSLGVGPGDLVHLVSAPAGLVELSAFGPALRSRAFRVAG